MTKRTGDIKKAKVADRQQLHTIEELAARINLKPYFFAGFKRAYRYGAGKQLTVEEFSRQLNDWMTRPIGGNPR